MFIDELEIFVQAGHGGHGCVSFRREKYVEFGGPDGGDGGDGGSILLAVKPEYNTLLPLRTLHHYRAEKGVHGKGSNMTGARGKDLVLYVPKGTIARDAESGTIIGDLTKENDRIVIAQGGRGGKGNAHFKSSTMQAPRFAQDGEPGEELRVKLELKIMADVGLVGFPNAGKSTLIRNISAAKPKVADYPFTTLEPNLGVVAAGAYESFVMADIPGIIEGAHEGAGLGLRFLRHIERTAVLLLLIDPTDPERTPLDTFRILGDELTSFSTTLKAKTWRIAITKGDLHHDEEGVTALCRELTAQGLRYHFISAIKKQGTAALIRDLNGLVKEARYHHPEPLDESPSTAAPENAAPHTDPLDEI